MTHDLWVKLNELIFDHLGAVTLKQLVDDQKARSDAHKAREGGIMQILDMRNVIPSEKAVPELGHAAFSA
jgi:Rrf2 family iron-sulfur cluster assembly transcriptional regulator